MFYPGTLSCLEHPSFLKEKLSSGPDAVGVAYRQEERMWRREKLNSIWGQLLLNWGRALQGGVRGLSPCSLITQWRLLVCIHKNGMESCLIQIKGKQQIPRGLPGTSYREQVLGEILGVRNDGRFLPSEPAPCQAQRGGLSGVRFCACGRIQTHVCCEEMEASRADVICSRNTQQ